MQKEQLKLSIIIPVYNVEDYIAACLESCLNQDLPSDEYEVVVINDGSNDRSLEIVNNVAVNHANIRVFSQENSGLSLTRNVGISLSNGKYVWFVDSDDRIEKNCLKKILEEVQNCDILAFGSKDFTHGEQTGEFSYNINVNVNKIITGSQFVIETKCQFMHGAPFYLFKRSFLKDNAFYFYPGIYHEDSEFTPRVLSSAGKIAVSNAKYYLRTIRQGSITQSVNPQRAYDMLFVATRLHNHIASLHLKKREVRTMMLLVPMIINNSMNAMLKCSDYEKQTYNQFFCKNAFYKYYFKCTSARYIIEGIVLTLFRRCPVKVNHFLKG